MKQRILDRHLINHSKYLNSNDEGERIIFCLRDLSHCDFRNRALIEVLMSKCKLNGSNFSQVNLHGAFLHGSDLSHANFEGARLTNANLGKCDLRFADLRNANLEGASAQTADFTMAKYNDNTILPKGVDPSSCKMDKIPLHKHSNNHFPSPINFKNISFQDMVKNTEPKLQR